VNQSADTLDLSGCQRVLTNWNRIRNKLLIILHSHALPHAKAYDLLQIYDHKVLPGLDAWEYVKQCATRDVTMDCDKTITTFNKDIFLQNVHKTESGLCSLDIVTDCSAPQSDHGKASNALQLSTSVHTSAKMQDVHTKLLSLAAATRRLAEGKVIPEHLRGQLKTDAEVIATVVTGAVAGVGSKQGSAGMEALATSLCEKGVPGCRTDSCVEKKAPLCVGVGVAIGAVGAVGFMVFELASGFHPHTVDMVPYDDVDKNDLDNYLVDAESAETEIKIDLSMTATMADVMVAEGDDRKMMANSIISKVSSMELTMKDLLNDMNNIIHLSTKLKLHDDKQLKNWKDCEDGYFNFCIAPPKPTRIVPANSQDLGLAMKDEFRIWEAGAVSLVACCKDVDSICDPKMMDQDINTLKKQYHGVDVDWKIFTGRLCDYNSWTICKTSTILAELTLLHQGRSDFKPVATFPPSALLLCCGLLAAAFFARCSRRKSKLSLETKLLA
jgi:hypothetical protein